MACTIKVHCVSGRPLEFPRDVGGHANARGVTRITIEGGKEDWQTLVFLVDPARSSFAVRPDVGSDSQRATGQPAILEIRAVLPCHFSSTEVVLAVDLDCTRSEDAKLTRLDTGEVTLLGADLAARSIDQLLFAVLQRHEPHESHLFRQLGQRTLLFWTPREEAADAVRRQAAPPCRPLGEAAGEAAGGTASETPEICGLPAMLPEPVRVHRPAVWERPALNLRFTKIAADEVASTPVFETVARVRGELSAYGFRAHLPDDPHCVRLVEAPAEAVAGKGISPPRRSAAPAASRTWFVAVRGLSYDWGRAIWNDALGELTRPGELDPQHAALFAPTLGEIPRPLLQGAPRWDLVLAQEEILAPAPRSDLPAALCHSLRLAAADPASVPATFPLLRDTLGRRLSTSLPLALAADSRWPCSNEPGVLLTGMAVALRSFSATATEQQALRIGALEIQLAITQELQPYDLADELRFDLSPDPAGDGHYRWERADVSLAFAVAAASPGGMDPLPGEAFVVCPGVTADFDDADDPHAPTGAATAAAASSDADLCRYQREPALVIPWRRPFSAADGGSLARLLLKVTERASRLDQQRIDLSLETLKTAGDETAPALPAATEDPLLAACEDADYLDAAVVLDREPFLVAKVSFPRLGLLDDPEAGNEVARWQSYGTGAGIWNIRFPATVPDFCLTLPPQAVGEEMEKEEKLERPDIPLSERRFDFRLSPPASLAMRQSYFQQSFAEAPWNLRELLANPGRELPGAQLDHLQYELLYGLSCRLDYSAMRLSEMTALLGDVQGALPEAPAWLPAGTKLRAQARTAYLRARQDWLQARWLTRQRLGIFELWDIARLDTLETSTGVTCWIRHAPLVAAAAGEGAAAANPTKAPADSLPMPEADLASPFDPTLRIGEDKPATDHEPPLAGGATWGFESHNVFQAVMRPGTDGSWPRSNTASTNDLRLTALGAYGHQMAAFDNYRSKILADATMGRTWSYTLERIGRIAVWWNRAKHVIVYERTVLPTRQFAGDQPPLAGRAAVRKVEEYVELLENNRVYPDQGSGQPRGTGFVAACTFATDPHKVVRYHVSSDWGADVGTIGWKVPLWMPGADPEVYPKPHVDLTLHTVAAGQSTPNLHTIDDPQNLFFYTDTQPPGKGQENADLSNTDLWPPVEGIDFCDEAQPTSAGAQAFAGSALHPASAADVTIPGGLRPCTFLLVPSEHPVNLVANRQGDPMGALLQSLTLCRANLRPPTGLTRAASSLSSSLAGGIEDLLAAVPAQPPAPGALADSLKPLAASLCQKLQDAAQKAAQGLQQGVTDARQKLDQLGGTVDRLIAKLDSQAVTAIGAAAAQLAAFPDQLLASLPSTIQPEALKAELAQELDAIAAQATLMPAPAAYLNSVQAPLQTAIQEVGAVATALAALPEKIEEAALPDLAQRLQALSAALGAVSQRIRALADSGPALPVTSAGGPLSLPLGIAVRWVLDKIHPEDIAAAFDRAQATVANVADLRRQATDAVKALAGKRLQGLREASVGMQHDLVQLNDLLARLGDLLKDAAATQEQAVCHFCGDIEDALNKVIDSSPGVLPIAGLRSAWTTTVESARTALEQRLRGAMKDLQGRSQAFFSTGDSLLPDPGQLQQQVTGLVGQSCVSLQGQLTKLLADVGQGLGVDAQVAEVKAFLLRQRDAAVAQLDATLGQQVRTARKLIGAVEHDASAALGLVRAFGQPPNVSGLDFERAAIAFFYNPASDPIDVTPVVARAQQAGAALAQLKPFGAALPVLQLGTQLIPAALENFDLSSIVPNIAGISLENLFANIKMPQFALPGQLDNRIQVKHGLDPQTQQAWVSVTADFDIGGPQQMFAVGPLAVVVDTPHFHAETRIAGGAGPGASGGGGPVTRRVNGSLKGDWKLRVGGFDLITFKATELDFDETGSLHFHIEPRNVQLSAALDFINGLLTTLSPGGVTTRFEDGGVVSTLDLPIPDTQLGAFGFSGLRLGASLALRFGGDDGFNIGVGASLARRDAPFTLTIFVLGGAGYLELGARYFPSSKRVGATLALAIEASASLAIALGPIQGGVAVYVGVTAAYDSTVGGGLAVGLLFMVRGSVSVLAIVTASIVLSLAGQYQSGVLTGKGSLDISIKICWCYTLEVHQSVSYSLATAGSSSQRAAFFGPQAVGRVASLGGTVPAPSAPANACTELHQETVCGGVGEYFQLLAPPPV